MSLVKMAYGFFAIEYDILYETVIIIIICTANVIFLYLCSHCVDSFVNEINIRIVFW